MYKGLKLNANIKKKTKSEINKERKRNELELERPYLEEQKNALEYQIFLLSELQRIQERSAEKDEQSMKKAVSTEKAIFSARKQLMAIETKLDKLNNWDSL